MQGAARGAPIASFWSGKGTAARGVALPSGEAELHEGEDHQHPPECQFHLRIQVHTCMREPGRPTLLWRAGRVAQHRAPQRPHSNRHEAQISWRRGKDAPSRNRSQCTLGPVGEQAVAGTRGYCNDRARAQSVCQYFSVHVSGGSGY
jgi:hypothetical protein